MCRLIIDNYIFFSTNFLIRFVSLRKQTLTDNVNAHAIDSPHLSNTHFLSLSLSLFHSQVSLSHSSLTVPTSLPLMLQFRA